MPYLLRLPSTEEKTCTFVHCPYPLGLQHVRHTGTYQPYVYNEARRALYMTQGFVDGSGVGWRLPKLWNVSCRLVRLVGCPKK